GRAGRPRDFRRACAGHRTPGRDPWSGRRSRRGGVRARPGRGGRGGRRRTRRRSRRRARRPQRSPRCRPATPSPHNMTTFHERSAGVIPYRWGDDQGPLYLVLHSATVRNPRAKWEFPKGGVEPGESIRQAAAREFHEETALVDWSFRDGFERNLSYTYIRRGRKVVKTVTSYLVEGRDPTPLARSPGPV